MLITANSAFAQKEPDGEVLLNFNYPAVGNVYLNGLFFGDVAYLPLGEVLSLFYIPTDKTASGKGLQGTFPAKNDNWLIDPITNELTIKGKTGKLNADKYYIGELDLFLHPDYFYEVFGITFTVNSYALSVSMKSINPLPIEERKKRESIRQQLQNRQNQGETSIPILYGRNRKTFGLGVFDYNLAYTNTNLGNNLGVSFNAGMELLGGDLQGTYQGNYYQGNLLSNFAGVRWRYVLPGGLQPDRNVGLASISVGQVSTTSFTNGANLVGVSITNNPVIPRLELDSFVIDGTTAPDSEVELLIGGQLVDFTRANEVGYYRFNAPVTYGTVRLSTRVYTPTGEVIIQDRQIQVPFSFLPKGFVGYNFQSGLPQFTSDSLGTNLVTHADIAYGLSNAITVRAGVDQGEIFGDQSIYPVFGLSARVFQQYLLNIDALPDRYYRANGSVFYASNTSINAQYTEYNPNSALNFRGQVRDANLNTFFPLKLFGKFGGFRLTGERIWFNTGEGVNNYQVDFNTQINRVVFRVNYRGGRRGILISENPTQNQFGLLTTSLTYTLPRTPGIPVYVRGMFLRGQYRYSTLLEQSESISILLSQTLFKTGRFTMGYDRQLALKQSQFQVGFLIDFKSLRSSSQFSKRTEGYSAQQSFSGSLAYDPAGKTLIPSNRDQITRSGVTVRLFVDTNENEIFDEGEEIIPAKAVRLDRSASILLGSDGLLRITQLQSYWKYRLDIDIAALPNPNLAPKIKSFYFIAEPNRFRAIDIPLYQTGVIDGTVFFEKDSDLIGQGGLRLILLKEGETEGEVIRTFSDGSFYSYGLLPGKYTLQVDPMQLEFMEAISNPDKLKFEIKALADGDYLEGMNIVLKINSPDLNKDN
ncbi:hypothetical protein LV84_03364 [Algoriphagus ratkowskyi]|uniref:Uncharacterized protein n=2 Tax=Algoriphagus ratkowskyi TaxID=57028 RepID=A0A2W7QWW3_9BACT|nr:hypothetical protein LV84_03364 [Algoriphagus ratkowskyi]TXD76317.1 hypothetical protein ESW18_17115 [Algoriphagus ratkowskyi]